MQTLENKRDQIKFVQWIKRLGIAGFLFFTIKGLLWLIIPAILVYFGIECGE